MGITKTLILVRHAHRDILKSGPNNGLSAKGKQQSLVILQDLERLYDLKAAKLLSSPKQRCIETLEPISKVVHHPVQIEKLLDEKANHESAHQFTSRIQEFIDGWSSGHHPLMIACSHGDWLPIAMEILFSSPAEFEKGGWAEVSLKDDQTVLRFRN